MVFLTALRAVAVLLLIAVPGYLLMKGKAIGQACISGLSKILIYVTQPALAIYTFSSAEYSASKLADIGIFALLTLVIHTVIVGVAYIAFRRQYKKAIWRVMTIGVAFANCAFFGIPVIEALFPEMASDIIVYTTVWATVMNLFGWTVGSAIISGDMKYISVKKIFTNPALLGTLAALFIFVLQIPLPNELSSMVSTTAKMATPLSMIIMGMRLATMKPRALFTGPKVYLTIAVKQLVMPLAAFLLVVFLPISLEIKYSFYVISACPVASVVLNYSEIVGEGQQDAASMVLLGTMLSIITLPVTVLLLPLLA